MPKVKVKLLNGEDQLIEFEDQVSFMAWPFWVRGTDLSFSAITLSPTQLSNQIA